MIRHDVSRAGRTMWLVATWSMGLSADERHNTGESEVSMEHQNVSIENQSVTEIILPNSQRQGGPCEARNKVKAALAAFPSDCDVPCYISLQPSTSFSFSAISRSH